MFPVRCRRIRYFKDPTFTRLVRPAPDVPAIEIKMRLDQGKGFGPIAAEGQSSASAQDADPHSGSSPSGLHSASAAPATAARSAPAAKPAKPKRKAPAKRATKPDLVDAAEAAEADSAPADPPQRAANGPDPELEPQELPLPPVAPHQADGLLQAIMGAEVDLSNLGLSDGKAAIAAIVNATPTVESLTRRKQAI